MSILCNTSIAACALLLAGCASQQNAGSGGAAASNDAVSPTSRPAQPAMLDMDTYRAQDPVAAGMISQMDAAPVDQRVPNWDVTRSLMMRRAPQVGEAAPQFSLPTRAGSDIIELAALHESKPVVLIFGSWT